MNQFPGTNYHDLNLDWILEQVKNCLAEWAEMQGSWETIETDWAGTKAYIRHYFDTLNVNQAISDKIDEMADNGQLLDVIAEQVASTTTVTTTDWLNRNITEPEYPLDSSLTQPGAAANAKATGDAIADATDAIAIDRDALEKVTADTFANTKAINKTNIPVTLNWKYGMYSTNGFVYMGNKARICSQVLPAGTYAFNFPADSGLQFSVFKYNSDSSGTVAYNWRGASLPNITFTQPIVVSMQHLQDSSTTYFSATEINALPDNFIVCDNTGVKPYINGSPSALGIVAEMYIIRNEGDTTTYKPTGLTAKTNMFRLFIRDSNGVQINGGADVTSPKYYDGMIQTIVDPVNVKVVGYYILHYTGTDFTTQTESWVFNDNVYDLDASPRIKEYLSREENLVLIGDSIFGHNSSNTLEASLRTFSTKKVFNCGFGGCTMAMRTPASDYDSFCFPSVADAIATDTYTNLVAHMSLNSQYPKAIAMLKEIDWTKPTTVFINYVNNDITAGHAIGTLWDYTASTFDKYTVLGAFNYGIATLLGQYPGVRVVEFNSVWRKLGSNLVPPYAFVNSIGKTPIDYNDAIKENAERQGIAVYNAFNYTGRNWYNTSFYQQDTSHYKDTGYYLFAKVLDALDRSFID